MSTLKVGRISLSCDPETLDLKAGPVLTMRGSFTGSALAATLALRDELIVTLAEEEPIPVTWDNDSTIDGFYLPRGGQVSVLSLTGTGYVEFNCSLKRLGDDNSVRFCSLLTGTVLANDHSYTTGVGFVAPPVSRYVYNPVSSSSVVRVSEDGSVRVYLEVASSANPEWHVAPADYYKAACEILAGGYLRAGVTAPNTPTDWQLENGLVKAVPTTGGALIVSHFDGAAWRATTWAVLYNSAAVGAWQAVQILTNRPERAGLRLIQTRNNTTGQGLITLDLSVRRGSRTLEGVFYSDSAIYAIALDTDTAGTTSGTPTGTMKKSTTDGNGHRWMVGSELTTTLTTADGTMAKTAARMPFMISKEVDEGSGVQAGDADDDLWDQYMGWRSERVRAVTP